MVSETGIRLGLLTLRVATIVSFLAFGLEIMGFELVLGSKAVNK
jgi:hypothetical protein